jgi:STE24 endopeptidase
VTPSLVSLVFALAVGLSTAVTLWLVSRQMRHVARHRGAVPADHVATVSPEAHAKAADYTVAKGRVTLIEEVAGATVLLGWTLLGGLEALNVALKGLLGSGWHGLPYQLALFGAFTVIGWAIELPFSLYRTFRVEQRFGFNTMTLRLLVVDTLKKAALTVSIGGPLLALVLWIMQSSGGLWWLWAWCAFAAIVLVAQVVYPIFIAPIFNRFKPLDDPDLKQRIADLMARCGFRLAGMFEKDGSLRSAHSNTEFTGIGPSKRVVLYDTLLKQLDGDELEAVLAHELGHFAHKHVLKRNVMSLAISLAGFALLGWLAQEPAFFLGLGVQANTDAPNAALALLLFTLALPPFLFFITPVFAAMSRHDEYQADAFASRQAGAAPLARALRKITTDNAGTLTPDPLFVRFYYSHPPLAARIAAMGASA